MPATFRLTLHMRFSLLAPFPLSPLAGMATGILSSTVLFDRRN